MKFVAGILLATFVIASVSAAQTDISLESSTVAQGGIMRVDVIAAGGATSVSGSFDGKSLPFVKSESGAFYTLLGVDMEKAPGSYPLDIKVMKDGAVLESLEKSITVEDGGFPVQRLTLPDKQVFLDEEDLARNKRESALRNERWSRWADKRYWNSTFIQPIDGELNRFGSRRIINDAPRSPHSGADISAAQGTPVKATAAGKVILTGDFFFTGNTVYIDHGYGLISMYFHLSRVNVTDGEIVTQGQFIGEVGSTGRATGPHLHWGIRYRNNRINPASLIKLNLR